MHAGALQDCMIQNNPARVGEDWNQKKDADAREQQPVNRREKFVDYSIYLVFINRPTNHGKNIFTTNPVTRR